MSWFHRHRWKQIERTYVPPSAQIPTFDRVEGREAVVAAFAHVRTAQFGVTTIVWECEDPACSKTRKVEMLGKSINSAEEQSQQRK
jgi:hypothetical protein